MDDMYILLGLERINSTVPHGSALAEITSTVFLDWMNLRKRSRMKMKIPPEAMLKTKSPTWRAKNRTKMMYN